MSRWSWLMAICASIFGVLAAALASGPVGRSIVSEETAEIFRHVSKIERSAGSVRCSTGYADREITHAEYDIRKTIIELNANNRFVAVNYRDTPSHPLVTLRQLIQVPPHESVRDRCDRMKKIKELSSPMRKISMTPKEVKADRLRDSACLLCVMACLVLGLGLVFKEIL